MFSRYYLTRPTLIMFGLYKFLLGFSLNMVDDIAKISAGIILIVFLILLWEIVGINFCFVG